MEGRYEDGGPTAWRNTNRISETGKFMMGAGKKLHVKADWQMLGYAFLYNTCGDE